MTYLLRLQLPAPRLCRRSHAGSGRSCERPSGGCGCGCNNSATQHVKLAGSYDNSGRDDTGTREQILGFETRLRGGSKHTVPCGKHGISSMAAPPAAVVAKPTCQQGWDHSDCTKTGPMSSECRCKVSPTRFLVPAPAVGGHERREMVERQWPCTGI